MSEKNAPVELCLEVLRRLDRAGVLRGVVLIGSWCAYFYPDYFGGKTTLSALRTRDIDFLIPTPPKLTGEIRMAELLEDLGFIADRQAEGYVRLSHPELIIDFLVAEKGRGADKPIAVKALGVNAQPLRFVSLLADDTVQVKSRGLTLTLPHPVNFALQKLIVSGRRADKDKGAKDRAQAIEVLRIVIARGDGPSIREKYDKLPAGWRKAVAAALDETDADDLKTLTARR
jgi:hypothetical protein